MKKLLLLLILAIVCCSNTYAMTFDRVKMIYAKLCKDNHLHIVPRLRLVDNIGSTKINASTGVPWQYINITKKMVKKFNDDQIAFVLGHELGHYKRLDINGSNYNAEYGADQYGKKYSIRSGYNYCRGIMWLKGTEASDDHPSGNDRIKAVGC